MYQEELIWILVRKYFVNLTSVLVVHNSSSTSSSELNELYLKSTRESFQSLAQTGHLIALHWINVAELSNQSNLSELILQHVDLGIMGHITILVSLTEFLSALRFATEKSVLRLPAKYYMFLVEDTNPPDVLAQDVLKLYPHHLLVSSARNGTSLDLWTQKYIGPVNNSMAVHLDTFFPNGSFAKNADLFPDKLLNMQGRTLAVATHTYISYTVSYMVEDGHGDVYSLDPNQPKRNVIFIGSEASVVRTFCDRRNCTLKVVPYGNDNWGGIWDNGSSDGIIGSVYRGETDIGLGSYYNWYDKIFDTSKPIAKSAVGILVPAPTRRPAYMTIILPFNKLIWGLIIISIFASSIVMHGIQYFAYFMNSAKNEFHFEHTSSFGLTLFQMLAIFFQQSFSQSKLDRFAARFFLSTLLLAGITLENTYSGQLKSLLTIPALTEPVDTIQKFALSNWKWGAPSIVWIHSIASSDISYEQVMKEKFVVRSSEELRNASYTGAFGLALERLNSGFYGFGDFIRDGNLKEMILIKDDLYFEWTRIFTTRGWPLMEDLNMHIFRCLDHGLYNYWERKYVSLLLDKKTQEKIRDLASGHLQKYPPKVLTISDISGPLFALMIGYSLGLVVVLFEIFTYRIVAKKQLHNSLLNFIYLKFR